MTDNMRRTSSMVTYKTPGKNGVYVQIAETSKGMSVRTWKDSDGPFGGHLTVEEFMEVAEFLKTMIMLKSKPEVYAHDEAEVEEDDD